MDKASVLARLEMDRPLFHIIDKDGEDAAAAAGLTMPAGDYSFAVTPRVLHWIASHLSKDMVTIETGAGHTTVVFAALAKHHYCCTWDAREVDRICAYLERIGVAKNKVTFAIGSSADTLPRLNVDAPIDFGYIDGCHGYPFPALDWHYMDVHLKVGGIIGMDNAELRPVLEHCWFLEENGSYEFAGTVAEGYLVRFYRKTKDEDREWISQPYSRARRLTL
jgi:predicted O-methyltransferase YrrM